MTDTPDTSREAIEKLLAAVCVAMFADPAATICTKPDCSAPQCRLAFAVRALLQEREALRKVYDAACKVRATVEHVHQGPECPVLDLDAALAAVLRRDSQSKEGA